MTQKVIKVGTSAAVIIPKKSLKELGLKVGDQVIVNVDNERQSVLIKSPATRLPDRDLLNWTAKFIKRYRPALEALARQ